MRAGTIPISKDSRGMQLYLVSSTKNPDLYTFPKGAIEAGESLMETALRELREEAGIHAEPILNKRSIYVESKNGQDKHAHFFFVEVSKIDSIWMEQNTRKRLCVSLAELEQAPLNDKAQIVVQQMRDMGFFAPHLQISAKTNLKKLLKTMLPKPNNQLEHI